MAEGVITLLLGVLGFVAVGPALVALTRGMSGRGVVGLFLYSIVSFFLCLAIAMDADRYGRFLLLLLSFHPFLIAFASKKTESIPRFNNWKGTDFDPKIDELHALPKSVPGESRQAKIRGWGIAALAVLAMLLGFMGLVRYEQYSMNKRAQAALAECEQHGGFSGEAPVTIGGVLESRRLYSNKNYRVHLPINIAHRYFVFGLKSVELSFRSIKIPNTAENQIYFRTPAEQALAEKREDVRSGIDPNSYAQAYFNYYRVYVSQVGDPLCSFYQRYSGDSKGWFESTVGLTPEQCVAVMGFDDDEHLLSTHEMSLSETSQNNIEWKHLDLIERSSGERVARYSYFYRSDETGNVLCPSDVTGGWKRAIGEFEQKLLGYTGNKRLWR